MSITFQNPGEADLSALLTMGVNVKEDSETAIGYFGTGFKFALATVYRLGGSIKLYVGTREHHIETREQIIRGQPFQLLHLDGQSLHITTQLGKTWEAWQAFRELYCNALDEGGDMAFGEQAPSEGTTTIHLSGSCFERVWNERSKYFLQHGAKPFFEDYEYGIYTENPGRLYHKGIFVGVLSTTATFSYNFKSRVDLSEDRMLTDIWSINKMIAEALVRIKTPRHIERVLFDSNSYESIQGSFRSVHEWSPEFETFVAEAVGKRSTAMHKMIREIWKARNNIRDEIETFELNSVQQKMYSRAVEIVHALGEAPSEYPVKFAKTLGNGTFGIARAEEKDIYLAECAFALGTKMVASTLYEETIHLRHSVRDCSRQMQELLLNKIFSMYEELHNEPI